LKPYVPYNTDDVVTEVFDAKQLYNETIKRELLKKYFDGSSNEANLDAKDVVSKEN
jgi:hypothetical protein